MKNIKTNFEDFINENKGGYIITGDSDYAKELSSVIDKYRQDFFIKIQDDIQDILGNKITKKLTYKNEIYYEINVKNRKFRGFFYIKFDKSEYGNEYCGIIYFDSGDRDGHEFFKKSSLIKILQDKQVL